MFPIKRARGFLCQGEARKLTLRKKTLSVVFSTILFMGIIIYLIIHFVLTAGYIKLETDDIIKTTDQASKQLEEDVSTLKSVVGDWAPWDDTYQFIQDLNSDYIENNLMDLTMINFNINFMVFIDTKGIVRYCKAFDLKNGVDKKSVEPFQLLVEQNSILLRNETQKDTVSGYALLSDKTVMLASAPILTSKFKGPSQGTLLVGKYLDRSAVKIFKEKLKIPMEIIKITPGRSIKNFLKMERHTSTKNKYVIKRPDKSNIISSVLVEDLSKNPLFIMEIKKQRAIFQQGKNSLNSLFLALFIISLVCMAVTLIFLERTVLYRLFKLSEDVKKITTQGNMKERISLNGNDEISSLSFDINQMLDKLWENKKRYQILFESASDAILLFKGDKIVDCNLMALELFDCSTDQMVGKDPCFFSPEKQADGEFSSQKCQKIFEDTSFENQILFEWIYLKKDKTTFEAEVNLTSIDLPSGRHLQAIIRDITERNHSQRMMIQAEKMLSLGGLAAGMAHEINNPLAGMMQNAQVIENRLSIDLPVNIATAEEMGTSLSKIKNYMEKRNIFKLIQSINYSGKKAAKIIENMLNFSRKTDSEKSPGNIVDLLDRTIELAQTDYSLKSNYDFKQIEIIREYESTLLNVLCHGSSLQQVIFNIFKNAAEAIFSSKEENKTPKLFLRIFKDNENVQIEIEDNGPGIEEKVRQRIFEPFFTTKNPGKGTGLGLSVSYFIINEDHNGDMIVESEIGRGTKFIIILPLITG